MNNQHLSITTPNDPVILNILCPDQQQEIQTILQQTTITDHKYTDHEINHLLNPKYSNKNQKPSVKNSIHSQFSAASESDENQFLSRDPSLGEELNRSGRGSDDGESDGLGEGFEDMIERGQFRGASQRQNEDINQILVDQFSRKLQQQEQSSQQQQSQQSRFIQQRSRKSFPYKQIYQQMQQLQTPFTLQRVQKQYPSFFISKPMYKLEQTVKEKRIALGNVFVQHSVTIVNIGSIKNKFFLIAGTDSNNIIFWEVNSLQHLPQVIQGFSKQGQSVQFIKWSPSMQYVCVSSTLKQVKLLQFRQSSSLQLFPPEQQSSCQWLKAPIQIFTLQHPKIKSNIIQCHFIQQHPPKLLLVDQQYQIYLVQMKKQFLSIKPYINKLPIKFNEFSQLKIKRLYGQKGQVGTLLIVGGQQYVTFALIEPKFQIILVFDKEKHFPSAKKGGFPNVLFVQTTESNQLSNVSLEVLIAWDKHMELIKLIINDIEPFTYKVQTLLKYSLPDSTVLLGNISDTLIFQLTRVELKIYSMNQLMKFNSNTLLAPSSSQSSDVQDGKRFAQSIFNKKISFEEFPQGQRIQQLISNPVLGLKDLRAIKNFICSSKGTLFLSFKQFFHSISIQPFSQLIQSTIQSINDWKVGLQLLNDGISRQITQFDNMKQSILRKQLREYSSRYIQFLKGVIPDSLTNNEIWKQQMCFLFNILIYTNEQGFLMREILMKLYRVSPQLLKIFQPFILMGKLTEIEVDTLDLLLSVIDRKIGRKLIYSIKNSFQQSQDHNQLAHLINNILIRYQFYLQIIWINQYFSDYYTPFVILISKYQRNFTKKQSQFVVQFEQHYQKEKSLMPNHEIVQKQLQTFKQNKANLVSLLSFLSFDTFRMINVSDYRRFWAQQERFHISKVKAKYLLQTLIPIMHLKLNKILIQNSAEEFFDFILQQLFHGNCLDILNELNSIERSHSHSNKKDWLKQILDNVPFRIVMEQQQQQKYWLLLIRLMVRKVLSIKIFSGLYYLTLQNPDQSSPTLIALIDLFAKQCSIDINQQLSSIDIDQKTEFFQKLKCTQQYVCLIIQYSMQLLKLLGTQLKREIEVLQCLITCKKCHTVHICYQTILQVDMIEYMNHILINASYISIPFRQSTLTKLKQILKANIKLFTSIDPQRTSNFIIQNYKHQMKEFIFYLSQNPKQQLNLLKQILTHYNYGQFLNNQKCKYLELLAITGQKELILQELKSHMFPLDDAIEICKKYQILGAWAYLLVKSGGTGNSSLAIEIYFRLMKEHVQNYKYNRKTYERWQQMKKAMLEQLSKCIQVCIELNIQSTNNEDTEWFFIIQQLESLRKHTYKTCSPEVQQSVKQIILQTLYPELIRQLLDQVPIQMVLRYLKKSLTELEPETSQLIIEEMVKACQSEKMILKNAQHEISQCEIQQRKVLFLETLKGFITDSRCYQCMRKDMETKIHYYTCGHDIHPVCNQDVKQCISCKFYEESMIWKFVNLKDKVEKIIFYNPIDPNRQKTQREIIRLSRQQKLKNFDQILALQTYNFVNI